MATGPGPQKTAGLVLTGSSPVFCSLQIYQDRSRSRSLLTRAKNRTGPDFQTLSHSESKLCVSLAWLWSLIYCFIYWLVCSYSLHYLSALSQHTWIFQTNNIHNIVHTQFKVKSLPRFSPLIDFMSIDAILACFYRSDFISPSFFLLIIISLAILVCLEHSFWLAYQGSSPSEKFNKAFNIYLQDKHALLGEELKASLMSVTDWATAKGKQREECEIVRVSAEVVQIRVGFNLCVAPSKHVSPLFGSRGNLGEQRLSRKTEVDIQTGVTGRSTRA